MGKFSAYNLPLKSLPQGLHHFDFHLEKAFFENMESADVRDADLDVSLDVDFRNDVYDLTFVVNGTVTVACDRCLDDLELPIDARYHVVVKYGDTFRDDSDEFIEIPDSESNLNIAYMIFDTVSLAIPIKHVHPLGKCNRAMSSLLKKHRATSAGDPDAELEEELLDEIDDTPDNDATGADGQQASDPRWDALKGLKTDE